jgi:hypothetical protein
LSVHSDRDGVAVVAVGGDDVVVLAHERAAADGDGLLADVEVEKATDLLRLIGAQRTLLEAADAHHGAEEPDALHLGQLLVDRCGGRGVGALGVVRGFLVGSSTRFFAHRRWMLKG